MCFFYSMSQVAKNLENRYHAAVAKGVPVNPAHCISGFNFPQMPVVVSTPSPEIRLYRWGLIPSWTRDAFQAGQVRSIMLNARSESAFEKPSFRKPIMTQRCLVPADGFFEWQTVGNQKIPWFIQCKELEIFSLGGIWDQWKNPDGEWVNSYSVITTEANPMMAEIHNLKKRMPLILPFELEHRWLDHTLSADEVQKMMVPYPEENLQAWTVSKLITTRGADTNTPDVKQPFSWPEVVKDRINL